MSKNNKNKKVSKKQELKQLYTAFVMQGDVTVEQLAERLAICKECPFNSTNNVDELTMIQKIKHKATKFGFCMGCGCPLGKRASVKSATCGIKEGDLLWGKID